MFIQNYIDHIFEVQGPLDVNKETIKEYKGNNFIVVKSVDVIINIFHTFGDLIHNFRIDFENIDEQQGKLIVLHLNAKNLESYKTLALRNCKGTILDEWKNPLPNLVEFSFSSSSKDKLNVKSGKKLYELLPEVEILKFDYTRDSDWSFIGDEFSDLNNFQVVLPEANEQDGPDDFHVLNLLQNSKNVEYLTITNTNLKLLNGINKNVPELKNLTLESLSKDYSNNKLETVEFKNVKYLNIDIKTNAFPEKLFFSGLEGFQLNVSKFTEKWFELIKNNSVISFALVSTELSNEELLKIPNHLPYLKNIQIQSQSTFKANEFVDFVKSNKKLTTLEMLILMKESEQKKIFELVEYGWDVNVVQSNPVYWKVANITIRRFLPPPTPAPPPPAAPAA